MYFRMNLLIYICGLTPPLKHSFTHPPITVLQNKIDLYDYATPLFTQLCSSFLVNPDKDTQGCLMFYVLNILCSNFFNFIQNNQINSIFINATMIVISILDIDIHSIVLITTIIIITLTVLET